MEDKSSGFCKGVSGVYNQAGISGMISEIFYNSKIFSQKGFVRGCPSSEERTPSEEGRGWSRCLSRYIVTQCTI